MNRPTLLILELCFASLSLGAQSLDTQWEHLKRHLSNDDLYRLLWALPKGGDLHNHHEYSVPMSFWLQGAAEHGYYTRFRLSDCKETAPLQWLNVRKDSVARLTKCQQADFTPAASLTESQRAAWLAALTLQPNESKDEFFTGIVGRLGDLERDPQLMADSLVLAQKQLQSQNAIYLETQLDPRSLSGLTADQGAEVIRQRLARADSRQTGVAVRMQVSTVRFLPDAEADLRDGFAFVQRNRDLWAGVNLVGREDDPAGNPKRFVQVFRELRAQYPDVRISLHAGESSTPDSHVVDTIALGAERIGHGINAYQDPRAIDLLRTGSHLIEINLISNLALGYTPDLHLHPFPKYLRQGIRVCLNTDDRGAYDSNLTDEYFAAVALFDLTWTELVQLGRWSLEYSFTEPALKKELRTRYETNVAEFVKTYSAPEWERSLSSVRPEPSGFTPRVFKLRGPRH